MNMGIYGWREIPHFVRYFEAFAILSFSNASSAGFSIPVMFDTKHLKNQHNTGHLTCFTAVVLVVLIVWFFPDIKVYANFAPRMDVRDWHVTDTSISKFQLLHYFVAYGIFKLQIPCHTRKKMNHLLCSLWRLQFNLRDFHVKTSLVWHVSLRQVVTPTGFKTVVWDKRLQFIFQGAGEIMLQAW